MSLKQWFERNIGVEAAAAYPNMASVVDEPPRRPRLAAVRAAPSREEFAAWRDDPTTRFVMAALARNAEECREH